MTQAVFGFDYEIQKWVEGAAALEVRTKQLKDELAILHGPKAAEYLKFAGRQGSVEAAIAELRAAAVREGVAL